MSGIVIPGNPGRDRVTCSSSVAPSLRSSHFSDVALTDGFLLRLVDLQMNRPGWFKIAQSGVIFSVVLRGSYESSYFRQNDADVTGQSLRIYALPGRMDQLITFREPSDVLLLQIAVRPDALISFAATFGYDGVQLLNAASDCCRNGKGFVVFNRNLPTIIKAAAQAAFDAGRGAPVQPMLLYAKAIEILSHGFEFLLDRAEEPKAKPLAAILYAVRDHIERHFRDPGCCDELPSFGPLSRRKVDMAFRSQFGVTPASLVASLRMSEARRLVQEDDLPICEIGRSVGFGNHAAFTRAFARYFGRTPSSLRNSRSRAAA